MHKHTHQTITYAQTHTTKQTCVVIPKCFFLEVFESAYTEFFLQPIAVIPEQALQPIPVGPTHSATIKKQETDLYPSLPSSNASVLNSSYIFLLKCVRKKNDQNLNKVFISGDWPIPSLLRSTI